MYIYSAVGLLGATIQPSTCSPSVQNCSYVGGCSSLSKCLLYQSKYSLHSTVGVHCLLLRVFHHLYRLFSFTEQCLCLFNPLYWILSMHFASHTCQRPIPEAYVVSLAAKGRISKICLMSSSRMPWSLVSSPWCPSRGPLGPLVSTGPLLSCSIVLYLPCAKSFSLSNVTRV